MAITSIVSLAWNFAATVLLPGSPCTAGLAREAHLLIPCMRALAAGDLIPLEILPLGEFDPVYRSTLEVQAGELPVLPLSIYGSVCGSPPSPCRGSVLLCRASMHAAAWSMV